MITPRIVLVPTILEDGQVQLREDTVYEENGVEAFRKHHRRVLEPSLTIDPQLDSRIAAICQVVWTPEVVTEYERQKAARNVQLPRVANLR
jgi:hypothetical protein